jgi:DNA-binding transcriptional ArsR family regulator
MEGVGYVQAAEIRTKRLHVAASPYFSLFMAARDAVGAGRSGTPDAWCSAIRMHLTRSDYEVLAPLATSGRTQAPDAIVPLPEPPGQTLKDSLEQILAAEDRLVREIYACAATGPTGDWSAAVRDPQRWVRAFVLALAHAWNGFRPIWQQAQTRLTAEAERVAAAMAHTAQLDLVGELLAHGRVVDDRWELEGCGYGVAPIRVADAGLTLVPLVAGPRASIVQDDASALRGIGYPLRPMAPSPSTVTPQPASLEALLGIPRTRILRELERPRTTSEIAAALKTVPSVATHHLTALEAAGLVSRQRSGRTVLVTRTARGDALLGLYDGAR